MMIRHTLLFHLLWLQCLFSQAVAQEEEEEYVRVLVGFRDAQEGKLYARYAQKAQSQHLTANGKPKTILKYEYETTGALAMRVTPDELEEMKKDAIFDYIEEDLKVPFAQNDDDEDDEEPTEIRSYGISMTQADRTFNPDPTWDQKCAVYLCVADSGVYLDNADIPYSRGDGYVDGRSFSEALEQGQEWYYPRNGSHGTEVAGIMIAQGRNDRGIFGVIPQGPEESKICLRVAKIVADGEGSAYISDLLAASEWCRREAGDKPVVVNLSFAHEDESESEGRLYRALYDQGVLLVAAAGNAGNSRMSYPASYDGVISVASINERSRRSGFSQFNNQVELSAPGEGIYVLQAESNRLGFGGGTSYASPFVAGLAARVWTVVPRCSNREIRGALRATADPLGNGVPNREYGYGVIRARNARALLQDSGCNDPNRTPPPTERPLPAPTPRPTLRPTPQPTRPPTPGPTRPPTRPPTRQPTPGPTPPPTPSPVPGGTPQPSPRPTPPPTSPPTPGPTPPPTPGTGTTPGPTELDAPVPPDDTIVDIARRLFRIILGSRTPSFVNFDEANESDPRVKAQNWLIRDPQFVLYSDDRLIQRWVLATFAYGMMANGNTPQALQNWVQYTNECDWFHTLGEDGGRDLCDGNGLYIRLDLRSQNLVGTLPPELSLLSDHLQYIHLFDNQISGRFPPELGFLSRLSRLELTENNFSGTLPPEVGRLAELTFMGLGRNNFSGPLPADLDRLRKLNTVGLEWNQFTSIPNTIGVLTDLQILNLDRNNFAGTLPAEFGRLSNLKFLNLAFNRNLTGTIPDALCQINMIALQTDCDFLQCSCCTACHRY